MSGESVEILPEAHPWSAEGSRVGVLVVHGFTGNPSSMRGLAEAFAEAGYSVELPRLPGHGTTVEDMITTGWPDWSGEAEAALSRLQQRTDVQFVAGLSMGGALTVWLATRHPELSGIICINAAVGVQEEMVAGVKAMVEAGQSVMDGLGSDIADPEVTESAYDQTPLVPMLSFFEGLSGFNNDLARISQPVLILNSPQDHVVPPADSDLLAESVSGPVERVTLERSYHVATQDYDKDLIIEKALDFVSRNS